MRSRLARSQRQRVGGAGSGGVGAAIGVSASVNGILNTIEATVKDNATITVNGTGALRLRAERFHHPHLHRRRCDLDRLGSRSGRCSRRQLCRQ